MSIDDLAQQLNAALDRMPDAALTEATSSIDDAIEQIAPLAAETNGLGETYQAWQQVSARIVEIRQMIDQAAQMIESYMGRIEAARAPGASVNPSGQAPRPGAPTPSVRGVDGSEYPAAAAWAVNEGFPPRVQRGGGAPTIGYVRVRGLPMRVQSGDDGFSDMVDERLQQLGVRRPLGLRRHVEMKTAAMMVRSSEQHQEMVMNHAPCGSEPGQSEGCHAMLESFLPAGTR